MNLTDLTVRHVRELLELYKFMKDGPEPYYQEDLEEAIQILKRELLKEASK